ncbi:MAG: uracil-DNA glycosylase [Burkholderiales bacterium]|jgi:uracil-DNA glycosylase family 4|uniref:uracil-DNA glycosylase n=1 Tax=Limnobacter sp. TaxID=2003368 RepID=UPI0039BCED90|nr:uracil-DNA glycosylase [Burkholderiales bacterium]
MTNTRSKADLFDAMGIGPVWELRKQVGAKVSTAISEPMPETVLEQATVDPGLANASISLENMSLESLREMVATCKKCGLCETRKQTVFGDGIPHAPLMVVGEGPGVDEDQTGLPFVGKSGQLLDRMLKAVGASRVNNTYIANVVKCHPPGNRNPEQAEIEQCSPYLVQQIKSNGPKVLLLVGRFAIQTLLNTKKPVGELRGVVHKVTLGGLSIPAVVTYHPAYLLRRPEEKSKAWDDLLLLKQLGFI